MTGGAVKSSWPAPTRIAARLEPGVQRSCLLAWRMSQENVDAAKLQAAALVGDVDGMAQALRPAYLRRDLLSFLTPKLASAHLAGASHAATGLIAIGAEARSAKRGAAVDLDAINPLAVAWAEAHAAELVVADAAIKAQIRALVVRSQAEKVTVRALARQVRELVGLDARRMRAVEVFEAGLRTDGVAEANVLRRTARYAEAQRADRALTIARTETIDALASGQQAIWTRAVSQGQLDARRYGKVWIVTPDENLCDECEALGEGEPVPIGEAFEGGSMGPPAHPLCRCATGLARLSEKAAA